MSCLQVIAPGLLTTVQDLGRPGYAHLGVSASGAADPLSLRLGNLLLGNSETAAALEMTMTGGTFRFPEGATFALAGSDFAGELDGAAVLPWTTTRALPQATLRTAHTRAGARCYLAVRGGIRVPPFLGSASTHLLSGLGGVAGRALRAGDLLRVGRAPVNPPKLGIRPSAIPRLTPTKTYRVTVGAHGSRFSQSTLDLFYGSAYTVTEQMNRMGLRLSGPVLKTADDRGVLSLGVTCGCIQVTNAGQPLILFVEQQTTGGYPLIASIISADLPSVGQLRPGDAIHFQPVTTEEAIRILRRQELWIAAGEWWQ